MSKGCCEGVNLLKVAYAILDKKGRVAADGENGLLIYKTKRGATAVVYEDENETIKKVSICEA